MFYIINTSTARFPYRVEGVENEQQDQEKQGENQFDDQKKGKENEKALKAKRDVYQKRSVIIAKEIMNKTIFPLQGNLSLDEAWKIVKNHQFEHFPIISSEGRFLGLLSEREILRKLQNREGKKSLKDIVSKKTLCAEETTHFKEVIQVFFRENLEVVPILDDQQKIVGILTRNDLFQTMLKVSQLRDVL